MGSSTDSGGRLEERGGAETGVLELRCFGGVELTVGGQPLAFPTRRTLALFVYLACQPGFHSREALAALLWGDRPAARAMGNLRVLLSNLRRDAGAFVVVGRRSVAFEAASNHRLDVAVFEHGAKGALFRARRDPAAGVAALTPLMELLRGEFLEGFAISDSPAFENWQLEERERLRLLAVSVVGALTDALLATGAVDEATAQARRLVALDPFREDSHVRVIRSLALARRRVDALRHYDMLRTMLASELGVRPMAETVSLVEQIKAGKLPEQVATGLGRTASPVRHATVAHPDAGHRHKGRVLARGAAMATLSAERDSAVGGDRRIVFIAGEPGVGKTTLLECFLAESARTGAAWVATGQCIQRHGAGAPFLPVLDALARLCEGDDGDRVQECLASLAPNWFAAMRFAPSPSPMPQQTAEAPDVTAGQRMLRELAHALESLSEERPVVLGLEDLHWSDGSTLELLDLLARRREPARLLIVGTYRLGDALRKGHALRIVRDELLVHRLCRELDLDPFDQDEVGAYLTERFPGLEITSRLARLVHERTEGNPLFVSAVADFAEEHGVLSQEDTVRLRRISEAVPTDLQRFIELQLSRVDDRERRALEVASVIGRRFDTALVADALGSDAAAVAACCAALAAGHQFLRPVGVVERADGTISDHYEFAHVLQSETIYRGIPAGTRARLHRAVGRALERAPLDTMQRKAELAMHYERGRDYRRAVEHHADAAGEATARYAHREAVVHLSRAVALVGTWPPGLERDRRELELQVPLSAALIATKGFSAPPVLAALERTRALARGLGDDAALITALAGLWNYWVTLADIANAAEVAAQLLELAVRQPDDAPLLVAHNAVGQTAMFAGEPAAAGAHIAVVTNRYDIGEHGHMAKMLGEDPGVVCKAYTAQTEWLLGHPDAARRSARAAIALAEQLGDPFAIIQALWFAAVIWQLCGFPDVVRQQTEALLRVNGEHETPGWAAGATFLHGWARARLGEVDDGVEQMRTGMQLWQARGITLFRPYYLGELAAVLAMHGNASEAAAMVTEGRTLAETSGSLWYLPELYRLEGDLANEPDRLELAIEMARSRQLRSLELRAAVSVARSAQRRARDDARRRLAAVYETFTEGFDTADLRTAGALLA